METKEVVIVEFKDKFYAKYPSVKGILPTYNPDKIDLSNGQKIMGMLRGDGRDMFVHI